MLSLIIVVPMTIGIVYSVIRYLKKHNKKYIDLRNIFNKDIKAKKKSIYSVYDDKYKITYYMPVNDEGVFLEDNFFYEIKIIPIDSDMGKNSDNLRGVVSTGDFEFDNNIHISSADKTQSAASFVYDMRKKILEYLNKGYKIDIYDTHAVVKYYTEDKIFENDIINIIVEYYERFNNKILKIRYIQDNIINDKNEQVRINNFLLLLNSIFIESQRDFIRKLTNDKNDFIRIASYCILQDKYTDEIIKVIKTNDESQMYTVLEYLDKDRTSNKILSELYNNINNKNKDTLLMISEYLFNINSEKTVNHILQLNPRILKIIESDESFLLEILEYIKNNNVKKAFKWVVSLLENEIEIKIKCIEILKNMNNLKAVEFLLPYTKKGNKESVIIAAVDAVNFLQKRIPDENKGTLTMMENEAGSLSINDESREGNLSLE